MLSVSKDSTNLAELLALAELECVAGKQSMSFDSNTEAFKICRKIGSGCRASYSCVADYAGQAAIHGCAH